MPKIRICHLTSVHKATDTRIFFKECRTLAEKYEVFLVAPEDRYAISSRYDVSHIPIKKFSGRFLRFFISDAQLFFKALRIRAKIYHLHDPELLPIGLLLHSMGK